MFIESWHQVDIFSLASWLSHSIADSKTGLPEIFREASRHFAVVLFLTDYNLVFFFLPFFTFVLKELTLIIKRIQPDLSISVNIFKALESVVFKLPL